ncbi:MAG: 2-C-methyl-D-erythritol 2,4-cyclodiphosphate synthase [Chloroflexi bacterium]|nr:2-C-methyl-D-erythritol 2,4-cyclodiphosphate synthase [Chloroflexota bacterium]
MRVGIGYDAHRFASGRKLILGGIELPFGEGLSGHSDADVLVHAIMDALLGAAGLPDIGFHFPPEDPRYDGASSIDLLAHVNKLVIRAGFSISNVDATVIAERPKIAPFLDGMRRAISGSLEIGPANIGIKATTNEGMGFIGRGEGIGTIAVAMLTERTGE